MPTCPGNTYKCFRQCVWPSEKASVCVAIERGQSAFQAVMSQSAHGPLTHERLTMKGLLLYGQPHAVRLGNRNPVLANETIEASIVLSPSLIHPATAADG